MDKIHPIYSLIARDIAADTFVAVLEAAILALKIAEKRLPGKVIVKGDALNVINGLNGDPLAEQWQGESLLELGRRILARRPTWLVKFFSKNADYYAHDLAR